MLVRATLLFASLLLAATPVLASKLDSRITIKNRSSWDIHQLFLSSVDDNDWGPDQLGRHIIESGGEFVLRGVPCDAYDVRLVDEDGDVCIVGGVPLCADRDVWRITNDDLLACQALTDE